MVDSVDMNQIQVSVNLDTTPILYTDSVQMTANTDGVTLDILQKLGNTNQQRVVARIGMSLEHAKKLASALANIAANPTGNTIAKAVKAD